MPSRALVARVRVATGAVEVELTDLGPVPDLEH